MLNDNNMSNADACKKITEIKDRLNIVEKASEHFSGEDIPAVDRGEHLSLTNFVIK